ncbi:MAG: hypothetical protein HY692_02345, partial [Cyanobacteria bacterium NC_groundwater_1444_Ag_S-0.65um_54_12]|nr:hypothetical protein [Cyanobacteria bacterium NC_groundwater_1444_Ag_S-0.65um_54_12]
LVAGVVLLSTGLAGCGTVPGGTAGTPLQVAAQNNQVSTSNHSTVRRAVQIAQDALYRYDDLRDQWLRSSNDREKDRIEQRMLDTLTNAVSRIRTEASGGYGWDARQVYDVADRAISRYESLRRQWQNTSSDRERRELVNSMLTVLTDALKEIRRMA